MFMIPFALALRGFGVMSGMSATAGLRYIIMNMSTMAIIATMPAMLFSWKNNGMKGNAIADTNVPMIMKGILFPIEVWVLSDRFPKSGRRMRAARLSHAMMIPTIHWTLSIFAGSPALRAADEIPYILRAKISVRKVGHHESYTCQRSSIPKKANPMRQVRLRLSLSIIESLLNFHSIT